MGIVAGFYQSGTGFEPEPVALACYRDNCQYESRPLNINLLIIIIDNLIILAKIGFSKILPAFGGFSTTSQAKNPTNEKISDSRRDDPAR